MKNYFVAPVVFSLITFSAVNVFSQSKREQLKIKRPDKTVVICLVPPPDVMTKASNTTVNATIPKVFDILKNGGTGNAGVDRKREFERVREELSDLNTYEVIEFRLCVQYGNGVLSAEEYKEAARELRPKPSSSVRESAAASNEIRLEKLTDEPIVFSLGEWKTFAVRVVNAKGAPVPGAKVAWQTPEGGAYTYVGETDLDGVSTATNLYTFRTIGTYTQIAVIVTRDTPTGFTQADKVTPIAKSVKFAFKQQ